MNYGVAFGVALLATGASAAASAMVSRRIHFEARRRHHEVGNPIFLQLGVMFSVLLAFVFSEVWGEYNQAAQAISGECGALHAAAMYADTLPPQRAHDVNRAIYTYVRDVVTLEWPAMEHRQRSTQASDDMLHVIRTVARLKLDGGQGATAQSQIVSLLSDAHAYRETRLFQMNQGLPVAMWCVLLLIASVLISCVLLAGIESSVGALVFSSAFTLCTVLVLVLVRMLDYPFEGALSLSHEGFDTILSQIASLASGA
jgi:uncharacterized protein YbaA (DUF1428 family)